MCMMERMVLLSKKYLKYYLDNITNWNKCMIYSYELGKEYNTASLIRKWKGVMKQVEQD